MAFINRCEIENLITSRAEKLVDSLPAIEAEAAKQSQMHEDPAIYRESIVDSVREVMGSLIKETLAHAGIKFTAEC